eukprot:5272990-Lingulodinium_polyedra.AAC.1
MPPAHSPDHAIEHASDAMNRAASFRFPGLKAEHDRNRILALRRASPVSGRGSCKGKQLLAGFPDA